MMEVNLEGVALQLDKNKKGGLIKVNNGLVLLIKQVEDPKLAKESGWYIPRIYNEKTLNWVDHSRPGFGVTYWIRKDVAEKLGLTIVESETK